MANKLSAKQLAAAAAEGVAIALNANQGGSTHEEKQLIIRQRLICGIPAELFEAEFGEAGGIFVVSNIGPAAQ